MNGKTKDLKVEKIYKIFMQNKYQFAAYNVQVPHQIPLICFL